MIRCARLALPLLAAGLASCGDLAERPPKLAPVGPATSKAAPQSSTLPPRSSSHPQPVVAPKPERDPDDLAREQVVGLWKQNYTGVRWLSLRPDGTGTMFIDPDWIARALLGDKLTMQIEWSIEDGHALMKSVSGTPESAFNAATTLFGRERNRKIAELTDTRFILLDEEDGSTSEWTRLAPGETTPAELGE